MNQPQVAVSFGVFTRAGRALDWVAFVVRHLSIRRVLVKMDSASETLLLHGLLAEASWLGARDVRIFSRGDRLMVQIRP